MVCNLVVIFFDKYTADVLFSNHFHSMNVFVVAICVWLTVKMNASIFCFYFLLVTWIDSSEFIFIFMFIRIQGISKSQIYVCFVGYFLNCSKFCLDHVLLLLCLPNTNLTLVCFG